MYDAWSSYNFPGGQTVLTVFNHIPGGGNALYMDGHVEYIRYPSKFPIRAIPFGPGQGGFQPGSMFVDVFQWIYSGFE
jgi:prepilin-type processing-associated H-X9-DG protein